MSETRILNFVEKDQYLRGKEFFYRNQFEEALDLLLPLAKSGHSDSAYVLGWCLLYSNVPIASAISWLQKAATGNSVEAFRLLGMIYDPSFEIASRTLDECHKNRLIAEDFYRQGRASAKQKAELGDLDAQVTHGCVLLGIDSLANYGPEIDVQDGLRWLEIAANQGHAYAAWLIGNEYYDGRNIERDLVLAKKWFFTAKKNGLPEHFFDPELYSVLTEA